MVKGGKIKRTYYLSFMWKNTWGVKEGVMTCVGLVVTGLILHLFIGGIEWSSFAWPLNLFMLILYLTALVVLYIFREKIYFVRWAMSYKAAVPALITVVFFTFLMGMIKQVPSSVSSGGISIFNHMLSFWPFILAYFWMTSIVGLVSIKHIFSFHFKKIPFLLNHLGLFIALISATLGSADMKRLTMNTHIGQTEWRATDVEGNLQELPLAIELKNFSIDEYPPKLMLIDNATGKALPYDKPENILLEKDIKSGMLSGWNIEILNKIEMAASVPGKDTIKYVEWPSTGATYAINVKAVSLDGKSTASGWVSCGSFLFPYQALRLDSICSLVMPDREPRRFSSDVIIYTESGKRIKETIEVNKPAEVEGWKIYQLSYDESKGRWSDISVFELVSDPWLPVVYLGIIMMMLGSVCMFIMAQKNNN